MSRAKKTDSLDLSKPVNLTAGVIERLLCPDGQDQAFLRDSGAPGLRVRVTPSGVKAFVFEAKLNRQTIRRTIGDVRSWSIDKAREEARRLAVSIDKKEDPRETDRNRLAAQKAEQERLEAVSITVGDVWPTYLLKGKPKRKRTFKPRYLLDLQKMVAKGGEVAKRGKKLSANEPPPVTRPGPIYPLLVLPLVQISEDTLKAWHEKEAELGEHQAARALMMFRGFLRWCSAHPTYKALVDRSAGAAPAILDNLPSGKKSARKDALEMAQVPGWWHGVEQLPNTTASAYLRALLLTGARREELAALTWNAVDFRWQKLTIADKSEETRTIPLTPYLAHLLRNLPRKNDKDGRPIPYVFPASRGAGALADARGSHNQVLKSVSIGHLTFHGLRRSFSIFGEAAGAPAGAIAQIMGHSTKSVTEDYRPRTIDGLRPYLAQIEAHILKLAGVKFEPESTKLTG